MSGINKVILVGRLVADPELRVTTAGTSVCNFRVATSEEWKDKNTGEKKERPEYHRIVAWDKIGESCAKYLAKGRLVYVEGRLQTRSYEDKEHKGSKRYTTEIVANDVQFLDSGKKHEMAAVPEGDDIPF